MNSFNNEKYLILFSGGKDSFCSTLSILEKNDANIAYLVNFNNGIEIGNKVLELNFNRILNKYGEKRAKYLGTKNTVCIWREIYRIIANENLEDLIKEIGTNTLSQINCLICRTSMYVISIILCKRLGIKNIVDGARICQHFAIEQQIMLDIFKTFVASYGIDLLFPVADITDDFEVQNRILSYGFIPKTYESKCLIGCKMNKELSEEQIISSKNLFKKFQPLLVQLIEKYKNCDFNDEYS